MEENSKESMVFHNEIFIPKRNYIPTILLIKMKCLV